jgi:hypothetical protein
MLLRNGTSTTNQCQAGWTTTVVMARRLDYSAVHCQKEFLQRVLPQEFQLNFEFKHGGRTV